MTEQEKSKNHHGILGDAGEFLTLYHLAKMGFKAHHVPSTGYDILLETDQGIKRISVKTRSKPSKGDLYGFKSIVEIGRSGSFRGTKEDISKYVDILACVAMDLERVIFIDCQKIETSSINIKRADFSIGCEKATLLNIPCLRAPRAILNESEISDQFQLFGGKE